MAHSIFDLFKVGIGPSSSHTVGPMVAANRFAKELVTQDLLQEVVKVRVELFGSLALTGKGHATDNACVLGLMAESPECLDADNIPGLLALVKDTGELPLSGKRWIYFSSEEDLIFHYHTSLPEHPNAMTIKALDEEGAIVLSRTYFSVGGGAVVGEHDPQQAISSSLAYPYASARELLAHCSQTGLSIAEIILANEAALGEKEAEIKLLSLWRVMSGCIERGLAQKGVLPGSIKLKRRARALHQRLQALDVEGSIQQGGIDTLDWVNLYAMAVNEENAAGGRVVTAPTNGAAGVIPAVLAWFIKFKSDKDEDIVTFLLTAGAVGLLFKQNASISAAEVGCQGEIGVACSMAAAGLTAALGGSPEQVENAAEIGMEHNLGLTCDPIDGLVQVPCIERNTMGAVKAINASRLALLSDGTHYVHLDDVIKTMHQTGLDMMSKYKETSQGGLAINVIAC
ncbi:L-serine dehydratase, iron-sulfur-dependent, single chain form [Shewanella psychrophila]|uniref:L-serine dehydratase n=1 Tax=Shewanella psychrophila TaxID=225848 RepID=A0A1S6HK64_9GAMM|nr:L-serine ammonia-lyase [Shewanella psychrophila]AQS35888.1 L-serine dehydratase, iron-sulfur-dependent, single chain form [Shewanella psychrophila]